MNTVERILGTSLLGILLISLSFFLMCSGFLQRPGVETSLRSLDGDASIADVLDGEIAAESGDTLAPPEGQMEAPQEEAFARQNHTPPPSRDGLLNKLRTIVAEELSDSAAIYGAGPARMAPVMAEANAERIATAAFSTAGADPAPGLDFARRPALEAAPPAAAGNAAAPVELPPAAIERSATVESLYADALDAYFAREYRKAIAGFRQMLLADGAADLRDNCQFWIASAYFALRDYYQAIVEAEKVMLYPASDRVDEAQLMVGRAWMRMGKTKIAKSEFTLFIALHGGSPLAARARGYLAQLTQSS